MFPERAGGGTRAAALSYRVLEDLRDNTVVIDGQPRRLLDDRRFFNRIPTSFSLSKEQVDRLIEAGRELLRNNPDYQRLLTELGGAQASGKGVPSRWEEESHRP